MKNKRNIRKYKRSLPAQRVHTRYNRLRSKVRSDFRSDVFKDPVKLSSSFKKFLHHKRVDSSFNVQKLDRPSYVRSVVVSRKSICQSRRSRRSVLFAQRSVGIGKSVSARRIFDDSSKINCKRR